MMQMYHLFLFFFQAEDGIRDKLVTGVQTCALPICTTFTGDREALTAQFQTAENWAAQWSGVLRNNWSVEAAAANYKSLIEVGTFEEGKIGRASCRERVESSVGEGA